MKYTFDMPPIVYTAPLDPSKKFILGTQFVFMPYSEEAWKEVRAEWDAIQNAKLIAPEVEDEEFDVPSNSDPSKTYKVVKCSDGRWTCECAGYGYRRFCSHIEKCGGKKPS